MSNVKKSDCDHGKLASDDEAGGNESQIDIDNDNNVGRADNKQSTSNDDVAKKKCANDKPVHTVVLRNSAPSTSGENADDHSPSTSRRSDTGSRNISVIAQKLVKFTYRAGNDSQPKDETSGERGNKRLKTGHDPGQGTNRDQANVDGGLDGDVDHGAGGGNRQGEGEGEGAAEGGEADDSTIEQVGDFVSMIMNHLPDESSIIYGPSDSPAQLEPLPSLDLFPSTSSTSRQTVQDGSSSPTIHTFLSEARSLFSYYQSCLKLIEASSRDDFQHWTWLEECLAKMAQHPRVSDKMKLRYMLHNKNNPKTFRVIQSKFHLDLDTQFYMGKMNLLHIACDSGWDLLASELVHREKMDVNLACPSRHMRPANLTPLMLASGAGHRKVVEVLLERDDIVVDQRDKEGFTALFHSCNHGTNRVGDPHGYFRRLWSWDLSQEQIYSMERIARQNSTEIMRLLITHGSDVTARDNTGATVLFRASTVHDFRDSIKFLVEVGCRVTHNIQNWTRIKNPDCVHMMEHELANPKSLARQARLAIWRHVRPSGCRVKDLGSRLEEEAAGGDESSGLGLPRVLLDYLNCR